MHVFADIGITRNTGAAISRCSLSHDLIAGLILHPFPAFLIDHRCKIIGSNHRAEDLLRCEKSLFHSTHGLLKLGDCVADERLRSYVSQAGRRDQAAIIRVQHPVGALSLWLVVQPVSEVDESSRIFLTSVRLRNDASIVNVERVMAVLNLTMAEAELAVALVNGSSIREVAERTQRKVPTLRWHLSNILRKTECADQADLARTVLLMSL
jgi:DNA-binding CsgD family transcriptional regulator